MDTRGLQIRGAEPDDYEALQVLHAQPMVIRGTMQLPYTSKDTWRKRCLERPDYMRILVACSDNELAGCAAIVTPALVRRRHVGELGLAVQEWSLQTSNTRGIAFYRRHGAVVREINRFAKLDQPARLLSS